VASQPIQGVFTELGFPPVTDDEVDGAVTAYTSHDMPDRDPAADMEAADHILDKRVSGVDVARALDRCGFSDVAEAVLGMQRLRVSADYLQTAGVIVNDPNTSSGPGSGHQLTGARWDQLRALPPRTNQC
jgi:propanediol dehydratase large subunit